MADQILSKAIELLANGFLYPNEINYSSDFFNALRELGSLLGIELSPSFVPSIEILKEEYTRLFVNNPNESCAHPYSSVYLDSSGLLRQRGEEEARKFYEMAGLEYSRAQKEPSDFLPTELFFISELLYRENFSTLSSFLENHFLKWFPLFKNRLESLKPNTYYKILADITEALTNLLKKEVIDEKA